MQKLKHARVIAGLITNANFLQLHKVTALYESRHVGVSQISYSAFETMHNLELQLQSYSSKVYL